MDDVVDRQSSALKGTLLAANYVNLLPLNEFLRKPGVEVKIGESRAEDRGRVRVEFIDPGAEASLLAYTRGHFYCDPNNDWAIDELHGFKENVNETSSVVECHRALEFGKTVNGFPTVKTCRNLYVRDGKWVWGSIIDIELDDAIPGKEDFYLSAYGYPEPVFKQRSLLGGWGWYVLGLVLFGCAVLLIRRRIYSK